MIKDMQVCIFENYQAYFNSFFNPAKLISFFKTKIEKYKTSSKHVACINVRMLALTASSHLRNYLEAYLEAPSLRSHQ
jgi:hypothetical protein